MSVFNFIGLYLGYWLTLRGAIYWAIRNGHLKVLDFLLHYQSQGLAPQPFLLDEALIGECVEEIMPSVAALNGHDHIVNYFFQFPAVQNNVAAMTVAAECGRLDLVKRFLDSQAVQDSIAAFDNRALCMAASNGHLDVVKYLLEFTAVQASVAASDNKVLRKAASKGHLDVVKYLLKFTAVQDNVAVSGNQALCMAVLSGRVEVVAYLLKFKAVEDNVGACNNQALRFAARYGHIDIVDLLLVYQPECFSTILKSEFNSVSEEILNRRRSQIITAGLCANPDEIPFPPQVRAKFLSFGFPNLFSDNISDRTYQRTLRLLNIAENNNSELKRKRRDAGHQPNKRARQ